MFETLASTHHMPATLCPLARLQTWSGTTLEGAMDEPGFGAFDPAKTYHPLKALGDEIERRARSAKDDARVLARTADVNLRGRKLTSGELREIRWMFGMVPGVERAHLPSRLLVALPQQSRDGAGRQHLFPRISGRISVWAACPSRYVRSSCMKPRIFISGTGWACGCRSAGSMTEDTVTN